MAVGATHDPPMELQRAPGRAQELLGMKTWEWKEWLDGQMGRFILSDPIMARQSDSCKALQPQGTKPALLPPEPSTQ